MDKNPPSPLILAPAGNRGAFLAAIAAGADAIYCGLKTFSARMEASNFTEDQLALLIELAHKKNIKVYVTLNTLLKSEDLSKAEELLIKLERYLKPDAIIIQDLSYVEIAGRIGFSGEIHLSTLANLSSPEGLELVHKKLGINKVVIPRELNIDEIKTMASTCPETLELEMFIHGALCYGVSGRCYWSSYLGGKSGLRGRCVQPCRRVYSQKDTNGKFFSCIDLGLDTLVKTILDIPRIRVWKIEGRKKGAHYVYYTVMAYKILRDSGKDPKMKKTAIAFLNQALGRQMTHYNFLPQRSYSPIRETSHTGSGLFLGKVSGSRQRPYLITRENLLANDLLRIGYEDEPWHQIDRVGKYVPKKGRYYLRIPEKKFKHGAPVCLTDRQEKELQEKLDHLENELAEIQKNLKESTKDLKYKAPAELSFKKKSRKKLQNTDINIYRGYGGKTPAGDMGLWLSPITVKKAVKTYLKRLWWWLPPVIWPEDEDKIKENINLILEKGYKNFVLNAPWQISFFNNIKGLNIWAGPFCNLANHLSINIVASMGFSGAIVNPESGKENLLSLPEKCDIPLGIVISGNWPLCISRIISEKIKPNQPFVSPKKEEGWVKKYGSLYWVYPNWELNLTDKKEVLLKAGYNYFIHLVEPLPENVNLKKRPGPWNWDMGLL